MDEPTAGEMCEAVKDAQPNWLPIGSGLLARYVGEIDLKNWWSDHG